MLSDSESETQDLHTLTINDHYAKAFEYKKEREELAKLREKYGSDYLESGSDAEDSEDSEDTEEDTDGEELTPAMDAAILRTLARIRKKDPAIYEDDRRVFEEEHAYTQDKAPVRKPKVKENTSKPLTIRDAALASALADADAQSRSPSPQPRPLTHTEEQTLLRSEVRAAFHGAVDSELQGDDDNFLVPRSRTRDEIELEEEEYKSFLEREVGSEDLHNLVTVDTNEVVDAPGNVAAENDTENEAKKKKKGKKEREKEREANLEKDQVQVKKSAKKHDKKPKEEADREFLMNYIFNRGWVDRSTRRVPTYNEIVDFSSKRPKKKSTGPEADLVNNDDADQSSGDAQAQGLSDEDAFDDLADAFETSYNFRFEEPGGALISSYPRDISSVRRESATRKDARTRKKERLEAEKQELLRTRREEIRKERTLAEAAIAEEGPEDEIILAVGNETCNKRKSQKQQKKEELARLKVLKANELRRKLEMVSSEGGLNSIGDEALAHLDLDGDWDPSKHDVQIAELYGGYDGIADYEDAEKPVWDDDINIDDIEPPIHPKSKADQKKQRKKEKKNEKAGEDEEVDVDEMDANLNGDTGWDDWDDDSREWKGTEEERKRKVDAYMDEVVNRLGFSGITSHMPTRFHYTSAMPEDYGLTPVEILLSTDAELNSYVGLKKLAPYRVDKRGKEKKNWDPKRAQRLKEFRENLHSRVGSKYEGSWSVDTGTRATSGGIEIQKKKRKGKKERAKLKAMQDDDGSEGDDVNADIASKSEKRKRDADSTPPPGPNESETAVEVARKKKRRRQHKNGSGGADTETNVPVARDTTTSR